MSFICPGTSSINTYISTSTALDYTYSYRQYCSTYKQYYYSRLYYCGKANATGPIAGAVAGVIFTVVVIVLCYCWCKKR